MLILVTPYVVADNIDIPPTTITAKPIANTENPSQQTAPPLPDAVVSGSDDSPSNLTWLTWLARKHHDVNDSLEYSINWLNDSFISKSENEEKAVLQKPHYQLQIINDAKWRDHESTSNDFRVRGRIKLPALKYRWGLIFDDPDFEDQVTPTLLQPAETQPDTPQEADKSKVINKLKNQTIAIGVALSKPDSPIYSDINLGVRQQTDIYLRNKLGIRFVIDDQSKLQLQQVLRYGAQSRFYAESAALATHVEQKGASIWRYRVAYAYADALDDDDNHITWSHTLSYQRLLRDQRDISLGWIFSGDIDVDGHRSLQRGPWIYWHQPLWSKWLFLGLEANYFEYMIDETQPQLGLLIRLESVFGN